ncbi:MAG TPA: rod shape-determining protein MreC [Nitrospirota bacterium]|nr:rod shape-determining protein MreC [Nitrospirota bacterium]
MPGFITRNKKSLIILLLFLLLFWLVTVQVKGGRFTFLERPVLAVTGFVERVITAPFRFSGSIIRQYLLLVQTGKENEQLRNEVERLTLENQITNELLAENEQLRQALGFKKLHPSRSVVVQVIGKESSPVSSTITVNRGARAGLEKNRAVITPDGVVGRVLTSLPDTAKIQLITDPGSTVAVRVLRNREEGLLEGKIDRCALKYVSYYVDIQEGDILITSGLDGIYPKGLPVATVSSVKKHEASSFQTVTAKPAVRFSRLEDALVLIP